ncbi:hypothetical protein BJ742DRAFT_855677 [Cladochytrium replicatum]|nr:hypothetical protein BJ742DRAFT_855677 [Cladochytrium replicatum]
MAGFSYNLTSDCIAKLDAKENPILFNPEKIKPLVPPWSLLHQSNEPFCVFYVHLQTQPNAKEIPLILKHDYATRELCPITTKENHIFQRCTMCDAEIVTRYPERLFRDPQNIETCPGPSHPRDHFSNEEEKHFSIKMHDNIPPFLLCQGFKQHAPEVGRKCGRWYLITHKMAAELASRSHTFLKQIYEPFWGKYRDESPASFYDFSYRGPSILAATAAKHCCIWHTKLAAAPKVEIRLPTASLFGAPFDLALTWLTSLDVNLVRTLLDLAPDPLAQYINFCDILSKVFNAVDGHVVIYNRTGLPIIDQQTHDPFNYSNVGTNSFEFYQRATRSGIIQTVDRALGVGGLCGDIGDLMSPLIIERWFEFGDLYHHQMYLRDMTRFTQEMMVTFNWAKMDPNEHFRLRQQHLARTLMESHLMNEIQPRLETFANEGDTSNPNEKFYRTPASRPMTIGLKDMTNIFTWKVVPIGAVVRAATIVRIMNDYPWAVCNTFGGDNVVIRESPGPRLWVRNPTVPFSDQKTQTSLEHRSGTIGDETENFVPPSLKIPEWKEIIEVWAGEYQLARLVASTWVDWAILTIIKGGPIDKATVPPLISMYACGELLQTELRAAAVGPRSNIIRQRKAALDRDDLGYFQPTMRFFSEANDPSKLLKRPKMNRYNPTNVTTRSLWRTLKEVCGYRFENEATIFAQNSVDELVRRIVGYDNDSCNLYWGMLNALVGSDGEKHIAVRL